MTANIIIFDFDGTIADTFETFVQIVNHLAQEFGYPSVTPQRLAKFKAMSSWEIVKQAELPLVRLPFFLKRVHSELAKTASELQPIAEITPALWALKARGFQLGILTSNRQENVELFLANHGLQSAFDFIYSGTSLFSKHKVLNQILTQYHYSRQQVIYIGDETRDLVAAQKCQIKTIAVGWGFNASAILAKHYPDCLISHPRELVQAVCALTNPGQKASVHVIEPNQPTGHSPSVMPVES